MESIASLSALAAPHGLLAVLGNHDYRIDPTAITDALTHHGVRVLCNEKATLSVGEAAVEIVGLDNVSAGRARPEVALAGEKTGVRVLLVHEPDIADDLHRYDIDLQLSGHSHGGQVRVPGLGAPILPGLGERYPLGLQQGPTGWVYTSRGIGMTGIPVRFCCPPEVTIITLERA